MKKTFMTLMLATSLVGTTASAAPINNGSGLASPAATITFNEIALADSTAMTTQYASLGLASVSGLYFNGCENACVTTSPNSTHPELTNFANVDFNHTALSNLMFGAIQNAASFEFASNGGTFMLTALLGGQIVEWFEFSGTAWGIYGFENIAFDQLQIESPSAFLLDNLQLSNTTDVPEPASLSLLAIAAAGLGFSRRRKVS
jgi:hypothetical protein